MLLKGFLKLHKFTKGSVLSFLSLHNLFCLRVQYILGKLLADAFVSVELLDQFWDLYKIDLNFRIIFTLKGHTRSIELKKTAKTLLIEYM